VPNPNVTIRNFSIAVGRASSHVRVLTSLGLGSSHANQDRAGGFWGGEGGEASGVAGCGGRRKGGGGGGERDLVVATRSGRGGELVVVATRSGGGGGAW
jgi:hypothetical protein